MFRNWRDHWYQIGAILFGMLAFDMIFWGGSLDQLTTFMVASFMALLAHQWDEYEYPGGAPLVINAVMYGERNGYDRFPGNMKSMFLVNVPAAYTLYFLGILFSDTVWLGLTIMYFGFFQLIGHGLIMNVKGKTLYNPGLATSIFLFTPLGIAYICYVEAQKIVQTVDYIYAGLGFIAAVIFTLVIPIRSCMDRNSPYAMPIADLNKFNMIEKLKAKGMIE